jgi:CBS domain-containing protein
MVVREAMTSPVLLVHENDSVVRAAKIMMENSLGSIIIQNEKNQPVGIITERDIVFRVIARDMHPRNVSVKEVMSSPLKMVDSETALEDALKTMEKLDIRRLGVTYKGRLEGVISDKDILRIMPTLLEILKERSRIKSEGELVGSSLFGYCDRCNIYSTNLRNVNGEFLCEDCRVDE